VGLVLLVPAPAGAVGCVAPPGTAAAEEYCENIPGPAGDSPATGESPGGGSIPPSARRALTRDPDGVALAIFTGRTGARVGKGTVPSGEPGTGSALQGDGLGPLLPLLAALAAALGALSAWRRRRGSAQAA
jgi:hypothetical protein